MPSKEFVRDCVWPVRSLGGVRLRHEVGDGTNRWAPPGSDTGRGPALSAIAAERRARGSLGCSAWAGDLGPRGRKKRRGRKGAGRRGGFWFEPASE